jgi:coenzyme F420-reducing hydrogenase beta subunit
MTKNFKYKNAESSKNAAIEIIKPEKCTGCFGCYNACPFNAIDMKIDKDGFFIPFINQRCTNCGNCQDFCPVISKNKNDTEKKFQEPTFYAGWSNNDDIRLKSSSGGIFPELAKYMLKNENVVFGVGWDDNLSPCHMKITEEKDLPKLMGSKYLQSNVGDSFKEVLSELKRGKKVIFTGTPCQIAALTMFTDHPNLLTIDLVCHGVPSKKVFEKYIVQMEKNRKVVNMFFRDKKRGWSNYNIKLNFDDGSNYEKIHKLDPFFVGYLQNLYLQRSCYCCPFNRIPRVSDITLGDFWGAPLNMRDKRGVSIIILNTLKGKKYIDDLVRENKITVEKMDYETATRSNPRIINGVLTIPRHRNTLLEDIDSHDFNYIRNIYIKMPHPLIIYTKALIRNLLIKMWAH